MSIDNISELDLKEESIKWHGVAVVIEGENRVGIRIRQNDVRVPLGEVTNFGKQYNEFYVVTESGSIYYHQFDPRAGMLSVERSGFAPIYGFRPIVVFPPDSVQRQAKATPTTDFVVGQMNGTMGGYESGSPIREIVLVGRRVYQATEMRRLETKCLGQKSGVPTRFRIEGGDYPPIHLSFREWSQFYEAWGRAGENSPKKATLTREILAKYPSGRT